MRRCRQPCSKTGTLFSSRVRVHFQLPTPGQLGRKRHHETLQTLTAGDEYGRLVARTIAPQSCVPMLRQYAVVVNGQDFVIDIETIRPSWGLTLHLGDEEATVVCACHQAQPGFLRRSRGDRSEAQSKPVEGLGVIEFLGGFQGADKPGMQVSPCYVLRQGTEFFARKTTLTGVTSVGQT